MGKKTKIFLSGVLSLSIVSGNLACGQAAQSNAAAKSKLSAKSISISEKQTKKISVKNAKGKKIKWSISKKNVASFKKSGAYAVKVTGKKKGSATLTCKVKEGKKWSALKCKVNVTSQKQKDEKATATPVPTQVATATPKPEETPGPVETSTPTPKPTATPKPTVTPTPKPTATPGSSDFEKKEFLNAGFESDTGGFAGRGSAKVSVVSGGHTGNALSVTERTEKWNGATIDVTSSIVKEADYSFSAWVKQDEGADKDIKLSAELDVSGNVTYPAIAQVTCKSGEWTHIEGTYTIPNSFSKLQFYFEGPNGNYDFLVDDVRIIQTSQGKESLDPLSLQSLKDTYSGIFGRFGNVLNYQTWTGQTQLQDVGIMKFVQKQYNSFTLENEMKPDAILSTWSGTISVSEAKNLGYVIPDNYKESTVARLNFDTVDKVLELAKKYNIQMRAHTLVWHQQTAGRFFRVGYDDSKGLVSKDVMDARLEFYVKSVMKHVMEKEKALTGAAGTLVYCWDVTNEYIHRENGPQFPSWMDIYGNMGLEPTYVKKAYQCAYQMLEQYGVQDKVTLFYNDYNEYDCADEIVSLITYINKGEKANICGGIGMQSHMSTSYPSVENYSKALDKFLATGLEVQVTELDIEKKGQHTTEADHAEKYGEFMAVIREKHEKRNQKVNPKGVTAVTIWGLYDAISWRRENTPLLFGDYINDPKKTFYAVLEAAE